MTDKKTPIKKKKKTATIKKEKVFDEIKPIVIETKPIDNKLYTIRGVFYKKKFYHEMLIKALERPYKQQKKTMDEWLKVLAKKNITF